MTYLTFKSNKMDNKTINTSANLPEEIFQEGTNTFQSPQNYSTFSVIEEIAFPKSRSVKFTTSKDYVRFTVNYEKIETQMKNFIANEQSL